jgi:hypothetical protein
MLSHEDFEGSFQSSLDTAAERFLSHAIAQAFDYAWRTPEDFLRYFKPRDIIEGLSSAPEVRVKLLVSVAGASEKLALRKSIESAIEDLQIALDEGLTDGVAMLELLRPDDCVRCLDHQRLWAFVTEIEPASPAEPEGHDLRQVTLILRNALREKLVSLRDVADAISFPTIVEHLPTPLARRALLHALEGSRSNRPLDEKSLLEVIPLRQLLAQLPPQLIWNRVIVAKIAIPCGFVRASEKPIESVLGAIGEPSATQVIVSSETRSTSGVAGETEQEARDAAVAKLVAIQRLPSCHAELPTQIVLGIESMYAELLNLSDDASRAAWIRESFPNESQMRIGLLALIELLDENLQAADPALRDEDAEGLITVFLFEERQRQRAMAVSKRTISGTVRVSPPASDSETNAFAAFPAPGALRTR